MNLHDRESPPDFHDPEFLRSHIRRTLAFYHPNSIDPAGGFFHYFKDDGSIYERAHRHLVSSTRFVFNYAMAFREFRDPDYLAAVHHGVRFLREAHRQPNGGYAWTLVGRSVEDPTNHTYGLAFVVLAYAHALRAGVHEAHAWLDETWRLLERRCWDPAFGLYRDEADAEWRFSGYRGQNANMHMCEALIAAFEASGEERYLERALTLAEAMTRRQASQADGLVWEHFDARWNADWRYHLDDPKHLFRPWGFQPGHQTEWAKLLLILERHTAQDWLLPTAQRLFDRALANSWDARRGGMYYGFAPERLRERDMSGEPIGSEAMFVCDDDKYFWVQAESLAAAALLAKRTAEPRYDAWYQQLWSYAWENFVDHRYGAWFRILDADNRKYSDEKSPAGKTDYHTMGACYDVLNVLRSATPGPEPTC
ncbi:MAG TPA: AGE family epimerase/isomerase [Rudaea sp.]|nr:AGE family epimerase/isomerase [Rudaea sp.]